MTFLRLEETTASERNSHGGSATVAGWWSRDSTAVNSVNVLYLLTYESDQLRVTGNVARPLVPLSVVNEWPSSNLANYLLNSPKSPVQSMQGQGWLVRRSVEYGSIYYVIGTA